MRLCLYNVNTMPKARWDIITAAIQEEIVSGRLRPGDRLPAEVEIASNYRVSRPTANRAVQELKRLGYVARRRGSGTVVTSGQRPRTGQVAVLVDILTGFPELDYVRGIQDALPEGCQTLLWDTREDPGREARYLQRAQENADAIFCWPTCAPENTPLLRQVAASGTPLICLDRFPAGLDADVVMTDNAVSIETAHRFLSERGHRRIAYFGSDNLQVATVAERYKAFLAAARAAGDADPESHTRLFPPSQQWLQFMQSVSDALFALTRRPDPVTAVICQQDNTLLTVLDVCAVQGLRVPQDLDVAGFADIPSFTERTAQQSHRLVQRSHQMGQVAAERIFARLDGLAEPPQIIRIPADFFPAAAL